MVDLSFVHASFASACSINLSLCRSSSVETGDEINNRVLCVVDAALSRSSIVYSPPVGGCSIDSSQFRAMNFAMDSRPSGRRAASVRSCRKSPTFRAVETRIVGLPIDFSICICDNNNNINNNKNNTVLSTRCRASCVVKVICDLPRALLMTRLAWPIDNSKISLFSAHAVCCRVASFS